jgi:nickel transport protein
MNNGALRSSLMLFFLMALLSVTGSAAVSARAEQEASPPEPATVSSDARQDSCKALMTKLEEQNLQLSRELRLIKRDIAALNQNLEKPGIQEVMAGIGYILGLFGVAAFCTARRKNKRNRED